MKYGVFVSTVFFIIVFIVLLDDIYEQNILPNYSMIRFLIDFVYMIGAFINSSLNVITGLLRLEFRVTGFLTVVTKIFTWFGGSIVYLISDLLALPFTVIHGLTGVGRVELVNICNVNIFGSCKQYYDGTMTSLNNGTVDGTNFNKFAFWFIIDFRYGSFEIGIYEQLYNYIDYNLIQNDRLFFVLGFSLAGNNPNLLGETVRALTIKWDAQLLLNIPPELRKYEILNGLNEWFNKWSDSLGTWEQIFLRSVGDRF